MVEQLRFTASCWLKADKRQVASARRKTNRFGGISRTYRCFETAILCARKEEHQEQGRMTQKKNDLTKTHVLLISLMFFIPSCNLKLLFVHILIAVKNIKKENDENTKTYYLIDHTINGY